VREDHVLVPGVLVHVILAAAPVASPRLGAGDETLEDLLLIPTIERRTRIANGVLGSRSRRCCLWR
jgi:hypothetical protein